MQARNQHHMSGVSAKSPICQQLDNVKLATDDDGRGTLGNNQDLFLCTIHELASFDNNDHRVILLCANTLSWNIMEQTEDYSDEEGSSASKEDDKEKMIQQDSLWPFSLWMQCVMVCLR